MQHLEIIERLVTLIDQRHSNPPEGSYVGKLFEKGLDKCIEKVGEECTEFIVACKNNDDVRVREEAADLVFHLLVALRARGVSLDSVLAELEKRRK
ncbi:MAG: phosphoribosyl-ATP diphosphatase [Planctomycetes bacterium]|nr:phosphoribosyl-ATP diphosphatase [Planctomycetota bacterium]